MSEESNVQTSFKLCECGCGRKPRKGNRYINGHNNRGKRSYHWIGGRIRDGYGYWLVYKPDHPFCDHHGYVREHRLVIERKLGRYLKPTEVVHHKNGNHWDNRLENLILFDSHSKRVTFELTGKVSRIKGTVKVDMSDRRCSICNSLKTQLGKNGRPRWLKSGERWICHKCAERIRYHKDQ